MAANSKIEWCDSTFNPVVGCAKISPGCENCYAADWAKRYGRDVWGAGKPRQRTTPAIWQEPRKWNRAALRDGKRRKVFCASLADVFDNEWLTGWRDDLFALIRDTPNLDWIIVTKRIGNARAMLPADWGGGYPNVWLLATVTSQAEADRDIPKLLRIPAVVRGLSMEPLLEAVDISRWLDICQYENGSPWIRRNIGQLHDMLDWVIVGGESGPHARPMNPAWVRLLRDQCEAAKTPFFFKQWGEFWPCEENESPEEARQRFGRVLESWPDDMPGVHTLFKPGKKKAGRIIDGVEWSEYPR